MKIDGYREDWIEDDLQAEVLEEALRNFKLSVDAWSEAAYSRERAVQTVRHRSWRLAVSWALGCALVAGSMSGVLYERHHQQVLADAAHRDEQRKLSQEQQERRLQAEQQAQARQDESQQDEEDLLAKVDSDVSRSVPDAMEPLAQLMADEKIK